MNTNRFHIDWECLWEVLHAVAARSVPGARLPSRAMRGFHSRAGLAGALLLSCPALSACVVRQAIAEDAISFNQAVETTQNQVLLLNIVRAAHQHPLYFTDFTRVTGSLQGSLEGSLSVPFGGDAASTYTLAPKATYNGQRSFDIAVLGSERFMRGLLQPVDLKTFQLYLRQGWPADMLFYLLVRRIDVTIGTEKIILENEPGNLVKFVAFRRYAERLLDVGFDIESGAPKITPISPDIAAANVDPLAMIEAKKAGLDVVRQVSGPPGAQVVTFRIETSASTLVLKPRKALHSLALPGLEHARGLFGADIPPFLPQPAPEPQYVRALEFTNAPDLALSEGVEAAPATSQVLIHIRSPEGIVYYLGEITRLIDRSLADSAPAPSPIGDDLAVSLPWVRSLSRPNGRPLFVAVSDERFSGAEGVSVQFGGRTYMIPAERDQAGKSMHCLSLLSQLLALHKAADAMPQSVPARIVGG